jgi:hypothetical protein
LSAKNIILSAALLILLSTVFSCDNNDLPPEPGPSIPSELIGIWLYESATANGVPVSLDFILQWHEGTESARFTLGADGSFLYEELDFEGGIVWIESGTFDVNGNNATITVTEDSDGPVDPPDILSGTWSISGDELTLSTVVLDVTVEFICSRQT